MKTKRLLKQTGLFVSTFLFVLISAQIANAACTGASPTWEAANPSNAEISACINVASSGDTIIVPAGTANWTGSVRIPNNKKLTLQGSGVGVTEIGNGTGTTYSLAIGLSGSRITGFTFNSMAVRYNGSGFRVDHNHFSGAASGILHDEAVDVEYAIPTGLIDNNSFLNGRIVAGAGPVLNNTDWTTPTNLGKADGAIYIEDNSFVKDTNDVEYCLDGNYGGAYVFRYNTITGYYYAGHSVQGANRALKRWEIYGNLQTSTAGIKTYYATRLRAGTGVVFFNRFAGSWGWNGKMYIGLDNKRDTVSSVPYGKCDGTHTGVDGNEDATGYPCRDQIGRGPDATLWNGTDGTYTQPLEPAYLFTNIGDSGRATVDVLAGSTDHIKSDRDYYAHNASFNGTSGVGCGTLANRPGTCTAGVGYWATDQSCSDLTGMVGATPSTPISGTLYKCTAKDTWTAYYTPYTYPHPLRGESDEVAPTATWSIDSTGLIATATFSENVNATTKTGVSFTGSVTGAITATYKDGMPGGIVRYDLNKEVQQSDTVVVDYTTPGDGIKDLAGNALADISDGAVSNGSTQGTPPLVTLTIGTHTGATVNVYPGINCGSTCGPVEYDSGSVLTLNVTTLRNYTGCTIGGTGCGASTTMSEARTCTVSCTKISPDVAIGSGAAVTLGSGAVGTLY